MDGTKTNDHRRRRHLRLVGGQSAPKALSLFGQLPFAPSLLLAVFLGSGFGWLIPGRIEPSEMHAMKPFEAAPRVFGSCHAGGGQNCVVDGDTFYFNGEKIRLADIDAPETHPSRCEREAELGERATRRLQNMLNAGTITLVADAGRDRDQYGRLLRTVERNGDSLGGILVEEGLARWYGSGRRPWC
jgi:endonuclease YncB( thermonuclease family)